MRMSGFRRRRPSETPRTHAAVPALCTKASMRPPVCGPDLVRERMIGDQLIGVVELVGPEGAGLPGDLPCRRDHVSRQRGVHAAAGARDDRQLGAERRHVTAFLDAERVGCHEAEGIAARRADESERNAGAAAGVFDDATAWFQASGSLCGLDHGERHAVLHAPGRVGAFELDQEARAAVRDEAPERHERRAADALQDGRIDPSVFCRSDRPSASRHPEIPCMHLHYM